MKPRTAITGTVLALLIYCALFYLCSCSTRDAGMVAARITGQKYYLAFKRNDKLDSAAVFAYDGRRYIYHPDFGSSQLPPGNYKPTDLIPGSMIMPVLCVPENVTLPNGCLPRAIEEVRKKGGHVVFEGARGYNHAYRVP